jgi:hypothetical protein
LAQARLTAANKDKSRTVVYVGDQYGNWARSTARSIRPLSSVILEEGVEEKLVRDAKDFLRSAKWYSDRGIPYRRGYLLHGTTVRPRSRAVVCVCVVCVRCVRCYSHSPPQANPDVVRLRLSRLWPEKCA